MTRVEGASGRLSLLHVHPGLRVQGLGAAGVVVRSGERLRIGRAAGLEITVFGEHVALGGHTSAIVSLDAGGRCTIVDTGHANVARNGLLRDGKGGEVRHGDVVDLYTTGVEVGLTLRYERVAADGAAASAPPAGRLTRDFLSFSEPAVLGRAHGKERELVVQRDGAVLVLDHDLRAHPDDARLLNAARLAPGASDALVRAIEAAKVRDFAPWERAGTSGATLVLFDRPLVRTVMLGSSVSDGHADGPAFLIDAAHYTLDVLRSLFLALRSDLASWRPPAAPVERNAPPGGEGEPLLISTVWSGGNDLEPLRLGRRLVVFASGVALTGFVKLTASGRELFQERHRTSFSDNVIARVRAIVAAPELDGLSHGEGSTPYDSTRVVDVLRDGARVRTSFSRIGSSAEERVLGAITEIETSATSA